jgi:hypothetical protein
MCTRKRPAAEIYIGPKCSRYDNLTDRAEPSVFELPDIKLAPCLRILSPTEKNVACSLHGALSFDDTEALVAKALLRRDDSFEG